ncbi:hypothetical protein GQ44DRAFT_733986 [Phaeosphaeriaceae sp. PMI808]|nr:hypothetical protein GQ44DRAFT_733986 [Phaeosphaeriaceae sp. PMI808]
MNSDNHRAITTGMQGIIATNTFNGATSIVTIKSIPAPLDSSIADLWLPRSICDRFESAFGLHFDEATGRYAPTSATREQLNQRNPTITFNISGVNWSPMQDDIVTIPSRESALTANPGAASTRKNALSNGMIVGIVVSSILTIMILVASLLYYSSWVLAAYATTSLAARGGL